MIKQVIVFHGETISAWRKQGYHEDPEHQNFRELLNAPKEDAAAMLQERFPVPMYVECDQYGSQARFLLAKLNPSVTHTSQGQGAASDFLFTDDVSLQVIACWLHLIALDCPADSCPCPILTLPYSHPCPILTPALFSPCPIVTLPYSHPCPILIPALFSPLPNPQVFMEHLKRLAVQT